MLYGLSQQANINLRMITFNEQECRKLFNRS